MENTAKKDLILFFVAMIVIVGTFGIGIMFLKTRPQAVQADVANSVSSSTDTANVPPVQQTLAGSSSATSTVDASASVALIPKSTSTVVIKPKPAPAPAPAPKPTPTPTPAPTPKPAPAPAPAPKPTPAPVVVASKTFPFSEDNFVKDTNWKTTWGKMTVDPSGYMDISAVANNNGGTVYLANVKNVKAWEDYTFSATFDWNSGEKVSLIARYVDGSNYTYCTFDEEYLGTIHMDLNQRVKGVTTNIATADILNYNQYGGTDIPAYISTQGTSATCSFGGHVISSQGSGYTLNPPYWGTVGFTTWDGDLNNSEILVKDVKVAENF